jgi:drug/metabolite transporter (DMT)-like permease
MSDRKNRLFGKGKYLYGLLLLLFISLICVAYSILQKEIWEDEDVTVGRSLDMFISNLPPQYFSLFLLRSQPQFQNSSKSAG